MLFNAWNSLKGICGSFNLDLEKADAPGLFRPSVTIELPMYQ
jgi:hypothetical protein